MNDRVLVEALRARDPGALAALYDSYAGSIYGYCWTLLGTPDGAQVALRDTLIAAEALIHSLRDPARLRAWLYALARGECLRRRSPLADPAPEQDEESSDTDPGEADPRALAWHAVRSLAPADREILELTSRHGLSLAETAAVLGIGPRQAEALRETAVLALRDAVAVEILVRRGPHDCPARAEILAGSAGEPTPETRRQMIRHLSRCETCGPYRARQVSVEKIFELLPMARPPETLRVRVMSCFVDPDLIPYRRFVGRRAGHLDAAGFPDAAGAGARVWPRAVAGGVAAALAVTAVVLAAVHVSDEQVVDIALEAFPPPGEPPGLRMPWHPGARHTPMQAVPEPQASPRAGTDSAAVPPPPRPEAVPAVPGGGQATPEEPRASAAERPSAAAKSPVPRARPAVPVPGASPAPSPVRPAPSAPATPRPTARPSTAPPSAQPTVPPSTGKPGTQPPASPSTQPSGQPSGTPPNDERPQRQRDGSNFPGVRPPDVRPPGIRPPDVRPPGVRIPDFQPVRRWGNGEEGQGTRPGGTGLRRPDGTPVPPSAVPSAPPGALPSSAAAASP